MKKLKDGSIFHILTGMNHRTKCQVVKIIIDGDFCLVVYKWFSKFKEYWIYDVKMMAAIREEIKLAEPK